MGNPLSYKYALPYIYSQYHIMREKWPPLKSGTGINPIHRIGLIHKRYIDSSWVKWGVQVNILLNNCKQILRNCHSWLER